MSRRLRGGILVVTRTLAVTGTYVLSAEVIGSGPTLVQKVDKDTLLPIGVALAVCASAMTATWMLASDRANILKHIESLHAAIARHDAAIQALEGRFDAWEDALRRVEIKLGTWPREGSP